LLHTYTTMGRDLTLRKIQISKKRINSLNLIVRLTNSCQ
jgi:hypothetical protein